MMCSFCGSDSDNVKILDGPAGECLSFCDWICLRSYLLLKTKRYS